VDGVVSSLDIILPILLVLGHDRSRVGRIRSVRHISLWGFVLLWPPLAGLGRYSVDGTSFSLLPLREITARDKPLSVVPVRSYPRKWSFGCRVGSSKLCNTRIEVVQAGSNRSRNGPQYNTLDKPRFGICRFGTTSLFLDCRRRFGSCRSVALAHDKLSLPRWSPNRISEALWQSRSCSRPSLRHKKLQPNHLQTRILSL
jgi:hypothetical protein